jgi:hypothetical protein
VPFGAATAPLSCELQNLFPASLKFDMSLVMEPTKLPSIESFLHAMRNPTMLPPIDVKVGMESPFKPHLSAPHVGTEQVVATPASPPNNISPLCTPRQRLASVVKETPEHKPMNLIRSPSNMGDMLNPVAPLMLGAPALKTIKEHFYGHDEQSSSPVSQHSSTATEPSEHTSSLALETEVARRYRDRRDRKYAGAPHPVSVAHLRLAFAGLAAQVPLGARPALIKAIREYTCGAMSPEALADAVRAMVDQHNVVVVSGLPRTLARALAECDAAASSDAAKRSPTGKGKGKRGAGREEAVMRPGKARRSSDLTPAREAAKAQRTNAVAHPAVTDNVMAWEALVNVCSRM